MTHRWTHILVRTIKENSPELLTGAAIAGVVATVVLAVKATPKALEERAEARDQKIMMTPMATAEDVEEKIQLTVRETVKATWRCYVPATVAGVATISCIVGANAIGARRYIGALGAYTLVDRAFNEYKDKVIETIGENKERKVVESIHEDRIKNDPPSGDVLILGGGEVLCYDVLGGRYFKSDAESIRRAFNDVDALVLSDPYNGASLNELYRALGLESTTLGAELGWNIDNRPEAVFSSHLSECNIPCLAVGHKRLPVAGYDKL
jgi:hypothetical protein